jgi:microcystin-dependent protein
MSFNIRNQNQFSFSDLTSNLKLIDTIELGYQPNKTNSGAYSIAIGSQTGTTNQGAYGIAIGYQAGQLNQSSNAIAIGTNSGQNQQKPFAIAIGANSGQHNQEMIIEQQNVIDPLMITISNLSGYNDILEEQTTPNENTQETNSVALGYKSGYTGQGANSIAIGVESGQYNQQFQSIALGTSAGQHNQGTNSIALGTSAGQHNQGTNSIAIGTAAGQTNQSANSIILNATGNALNSTTSGLFVRPLNIDNSNQVLSYNANTREINVEPNPIQIGTFKYSVRTSDHTGGWLLCDGRLLNKNEYPLLFAVMGYSFGGSGDFFQLPDSRSRMVGTIGQGTGLTNRTIGQKVGSETHTLTIDEMPVHTHTITDPGHTHTYRDPNTTGNQSFPIESPFPAANSDRENVNTSTSTTGITLGNTGGGLGYDIMQPILFIGSLFVYAD